MAIRRLDDLFTKPYGRKSRTQSPSPGPFRLGTPLRVSMRRPAVGGEAGRRGWGDSYSIPPVIPVEAWSKVARRWLPIAFLTNPADGALFLKTLSLARLLEAVRAKLPRSASVERAALDGALLEINDLAVIPFTDRDDFEVPEA